MSQIPAAAPTIRILVADDHQIVRAGITQFLADERDLTIAGEAATGSEVLNQIRHKDFDVVLLDISMPDKNGIDTLRVIRQTKPELAVLVLSNYPEEQYAINMLRAGANGYICKDAAPEEIIRDEVVKLLNEALATELVCVLRYRRHYFMATGPNSESAATEFLEHAKEEQEHADTIAERIVQLGGEPNFSPRGSRAVVMPNT